MNDHKYSRSLAALAAVLMLGGAVAARAESPGGDPIAGKQLYVQTCLVCHGATGKGDGPASVALNPKPMNFTDTARMSKIPPEMRTKAVTEGGASVGASAVMPAFGASLSAKQIQDVLAYVSVSFVPKEAVVASH